MPAKRLYSTEDIAALVGKLMDDTRVWPVVVVTTRHQEVDPPIAADRLAQDVAPVPVYLVATGELTWELTSLLPDGLGVYGGAARIWWPCLRAAARPHEHPLVFAYSPAEGGRAAQRIREELAQHEEGGHQHWLLWQRKQPRPAAVGAASTTRPYRSGAIVTGTVVHAAPGGAEVQLEAGVCGWLVRRRRDPVLAAGDQVDVRVVGYEGNEVLLERAPRPQAAAQITLPCPRQRRGPVQPRLLPSSLPHQPALPSVAAGEASTLRAAITDLDLRLLEAEEDRRSAEARAEEAAAELTRAVKASRRAAQHQRQEVRSLRDRVSFLEAQLHGIGRFADAEQQFRHEVQIAWSNLTAGADCARWPLQDYVVGPFFLSSVEALEGITRAKIVEVCAHVVSGRIT